MNSTIQYVLSLFELSIVEMALHRLTWNGLSNCPRGYDQVVAQKIRKIRNLVDLRLDSAGHENRACRAPVLSKSFIWMKVHRLW